MSEDDDTRVGYRHPPREHCFKKGQSGNQRGRRKGAGNLLTTFKKIAREKIRVRIAGKVRVITWCQYVILFNYYAALSKSQNAMNNMLMFAEETGQFIDQDDLKQMGAPIAQSQGLTLEEFEAMFGNSVPGAHAAKDPRGQH